MKFDKQDSRILELMIVDGYSYEDACRELSKNLDRIYISLHKSFCYREDGRNVMYVPKGVFLNETNISGAKFFPEKMRQSKRNPNEIYTVYYEYQGKSDEIELQLRYSTLKVSARSLRDAINKHKSDYRNRRNSNG